MVHISVFSRRGVIKREETRPLHVIQQSIQELTKWQDVTKKCFELGISNKDGHSKRLLIIGLFELKKKKHSTQHPTAKIFKNFH